MKIRGHERTNRFYEKDGWNRAKILELIKNKNDFPNIFRKIESKISEAIITNYKKNTAEIIDEPYYTVYCGHIIFDKEKVQQHEYIPYSVDNHRPCDEDKSFGNKNKWE